jgi:prophage maintenance system killer protein
MTRFVYNTFRLNALIFTTYFLQLDGSQVKEDDDDSIQKINQIKASISAGKILEEKKETNGTHAKLETLT